MKRLNAFFLVLGLCIASTALGDPAGNNLLQQPLTRQVAVEYALSHNRAYRAAFEDVSVAGEKVAQSRADFFPRIDGSYAFTQLSDQPFVSIVGTPFQRVPFSIQTINRWQVDLVQPLFTGFGLESQYKASKVGLKISQYQLDEARLNLVRDVQIACLQTLLGEKLVQVARDNVASLGVQKKNAEANFQQGVAAQNDVLKADVALSQAVQRERSTVKQLIILRSNLNQLLDLDLQEKVELAGIDEKTYQVPDLHELYSAAEDKRPEYLAVKASMQQAKYSKTAARSRYYPRVSAFAEYYREGEDFVADKNPFSNNENASVGVRVDWNLFEGGKTRATELEWEYRLRGIEQRRDDLLQRIRLQVENAFEQLKVAKANIDTTRVAVQQAEENDRITTLQYKEQVAIFLEVLNAQVFLAQTRADFYQALYGYEIAMAELERAIGGPIN
ncbi:MAG: TolC family protein [Syntrophobacteraceae bacterium]|jgi:outer membrane protein TolC